MVEVGATGVCVEDSLHVVLELCGVSLDGDAYGPFCNGSLELINTLFWHVINLLDFDSTFAGNYSALGVTSKVWVVLLELLKSLLGVLESIFLQTSVASV